LQSNYDSGQVNPLAYTTNFVVGWLKGRSDPLIDASLFAVKGASSSPK
jgi:hypothetical protein